MLKGDLDAGLRYEEDQGWFQWQCLLALGTPLDKLFHLCHHAGPMEPVLKLLQGVLGPRWPPSGWCRPGASLHQL